MYSGGCNKSPSERYDGNKILVVENDASELDENNIWRDGGKNEQIFKDRIPGSKRAINQDSWFQSKGEPEDWNGRPQMENFVKFGNKHALIIRTDYIEQDFKMGKGGGWCAPILRVQILSTEKSKRPNFGVPTPCKLNSITMYVL